MRGTTGLLANSALGPMAGAGAGPQGFVGMGDVEAAPEEDQPNVSPQEQQQYDSLVQNGMEMLYTKDGEVNPEIVKRLSTGNKFMDSLAQTGVWLVMMLEQSAEKSGSPISDDVLMHGGKELFEQLVEIDEKLGIHTFKEAEVQGAWYQALDLYREANSDDGGRFDAEGGQEASEAFAELNQADQEGRADEVVPGFYQTVESGLSAAKADQNETDEGTQDEKIRLNDRAVGRG